VPFTIASTINDFWNSGAWPVAILVAILSVAWPVCKNAALVYIWFAPETILGPERRGKVLRVLDSLGKWSFLDVFVIVLMLAGLKL
jgi:paraquat-inducible protein A